MRYPVKRYRDMRPIERELLTAHTYGEHGWHDNSGPIPYTPHSFCPACRDPDYYRKIGAYWHAVFSADPS